MTEEKNQALVAAEAELNRRALAMKENIQVSTNVIGVQKNGKFKMPGGEERDELLAVIVDYRYRNQHFPEDYQPGVFTPPNCFAIGTQQESMVPSIESPEAQNEQCTGCPKNEFGSAKNGTGKGKACQNQFLVAIMMPDLGESEEVFVLKASPTAARAVASYVTNMAEQQGHPMKAVTKFTIEVGNWAKVKANFHAINNNWPEHFEYVSLAERVLETVPKKGEVVKDTKIDTGAARGANPARQRPTG